MSSHIFSYQGHSKSFFMTGASSRTNANCHVKWRELRGNSNGRDFYTADYLSVLTQFKSNAILNLLAARNPNSKHTLLRDPVIKNNYKSLRAFQLVWAQLAAWRSARRQGEKESKELVARSEYLPVRSFPPVYSLAAFSRYVPTGWTRKRRYKGSVSAKRQNRWLIKRRDHPRIN